MQPSSLIFLVIIAIWAAYFVQHWVRRREHLATVRSVDQFTESMRVLERRSPLPAPDLSEPQPRSYPVSPARASRPHVLVKRAAPSAAGTAEPTAADAAASSKQAPLPSRRRARGLTFLAALTSLPVTVTLAVLAVVPWVALAAPVAAVAVVLVWMRRGAQAERAARREATRRQRAQRDARDLGEAAAHTRSGIGAPSRERRAASTRATAASARAGIELHAATPDDSVPPAHSPVGLADVAADVTADVDADIAADVDAVTREDADADRSAARGGLYDIQAVERAAAQVPAAAAAAAAAARSLGVAAPLMPAGLLVDEDDIPLTWDPVPVPRPTYTMKAMAQRHAPAPVGQGVPPELAEPAYEEPVRRVAGA